MIDFDKLPKLMYKKNFEEYSKRDKEGQLTKEDVDDWIEAFEWTITTMTSKEFKDFQSGENKIT